MLAQATVKHLPIKSDSVDLIFTDPPYLLKYLPLYGWLAREAMRVLKPGGFVLAMCGGAYLNQIFRMFDDAELTYYWKHENEMTGATSGQVWRNIPGNIRAPIVVRQKSILAYSKTPAVARCQVIDVYRGNGSDKRFHHWGQDVDTARYFIDCYSHPGDVVLDPFVGGGTTLEACGLIGRYGIGFDTDMDALLTTAGRLDATDIGWQVGMFAAFQPSFAADH